LNKDDDEDDDSSDEEKQNYFAGGEKSYVANAVDDAPRQLHARVTKLYLFMIICAHSGVMVQGPPGKKDPNALVEDILKKAAK
jgi:UBX domain-containing protein 1